MPQAASWWRSWRRAGRASLLAAALACGSAGVAAQIDEGLPWFAASRPTALAYEAAALLADAPSHGLQGEDYDAAALHEALVRTTREPAGPAEMRRLAQALHSAMQAYLADLHQGRIDPRSLHHDFDAPRDALPAVPGRVPFDAAALLDRALAQDALTPAVREAAPRLPQYERLRQALARYRALADHPAWQQPLPPLPPVPGRARGRPGTLEPGGTYAGLALLAERLAALGDLPADAVPGPAAPAAAVASAASAAVMSPEAPRYDARLVAAVQAFQHRHGLPADGRLGPGTLARLEIGPAARARQIELTLERLRWTPWQQGPRMIVVNVPEFVLRAYEVDADGRIQVRLAMKVIVGAALRTQTPLIDEELRSIELNPYWNVPPSIARAELVPDLRRSPGLFAREGYEFVGADGTVSTTLDAGQLGAVLAGQARIRQRPGPRNALGMIKFVFPNRDAIYLHDTSAPRLFERERRDFSHGCIRIEQPLALARLVLAGQPEGDEARLRQLLADGKNAFVRVARPWQVLIAYATVLVKQDRVFFFDDLYGHDQALDAALQSRGPTRLQPPALPASAPTTAAARP